MRARGWRFSFFWFLRTFNKVVEPLDGGVLHDACRGRVGSAVQPAVGDVSTKRKRFAQRENVVALRGAIDCLFNVAQRDQLELYLPPSPRGWVAKPSKQAGCPGGCRRLEAALL